jgi:hypothetical protein
MKNSPFLYAVFPNSEFSRTHSFRSIVWTWFLGNGVGVGDEPPLVGEGKGPLFELVSS